MTKQFEIGDLVKSEKCVFRVAGFTSGAAVIPDGWLIDKDGFTHNPKFCEHYNGAESVLEGIV